MSMSRVPWSTFARCRVCLAMVDIRPPIGADGRHSTVDLSRPLVAQTLQQIIEVQPQGSASTIVLLPRTGILAFSDAQIPVIIQRVIDVHLETEVVTEVTARAVEK